MQENAAIRAGAGERNKAPVELPIPVTSPAPSCPHRCHPSVLSVQHQGVSQQNPHTSHTGQPCSQRPPWSGCVRGCLSVCLSRLLGHPAKAPVGCYLVGILTPLTGGNTDRATRTLPAAQGRLQGLIDAYSSLAHKNCHSWRKYSRGQRLPTASMGLHPWG